MGDTKNEVTTDRIFYFEKQFFYAVSKVFVTCKICHEWWNEKMLSIPIPNSEYSLYV